MAGPTEPAIETTEPAKVFNDPILNYVWKLKQNGKSEETIKGRLRSLKQMARICDINNPEAIKTALTELKWKRSVKRKFCKTYSNFLKLNNRTWEEPNYKPEESLPFIPLETEIDQLIAYMGKKTAPFVQLLKETGMRGGEATLLKWTDIDTERKTINITPLKGSNPRILPISEKLITMLNFMAKTHEKIFYQGLHVYRTAFCKQRKKASIKLSNQRMLKISFHTLRHWKGTMEYHKSKDVKHVQYVLGHKHSNSTDLYINLEQALLLKESDEWCSRISHTLEEETQLIEAGFTLVRGINETTAIYRKRK